MPSPYIEYHIDFDENKIFESDEEVGSDLKALTFTRGKDLTANRAPASTLLTSMHNFDGKYSPTNTSSPLYPFQLPGPDVRIRMAYPYDAFSGDNSDALNGRVLPKADNQAVAEGGWDAWVADSEFVVESNHIEVDAAGNDLLATLDFGIANIRLGADIAREGGSISYPYKQSLFVFRKQDSLNYNEIYLSAPDSSITFIEVGKVVAGVPTAYGTTVNGSMDLYWTKGEAARVEVEIYDEEVKIWVNDYLAAINSGAVNNFLTETEHGIGGETISTNAASGAAGSRVAQWDNFGGWNTMFSGRSDTVEPTPGIDAEANIASWDDFERLNRHPIFRTAEAPRFARNLIDIVLEAGDVPADRPLLDGAEPFIGAIRLADTGEILMADFDKAMGFTGLGELYQIQDDDVGFIWIDGRGTYRYEATDHRDSAPHDAVAGTWQDVSGSAPSISMEPKPKWTDGKDVVENEIFYRFNRASLSLAATAWILEVDDNPDFWNAPAVNNGKGWYTLEITALSDGDTMGNIKNPIPGSGYTIHENANGTGVNWLTPIASETGTVSMVDNIPTALELDDTGQDFSGSGSVGAGSFGKSGKLITVRDASGNTAVGYAVSTAVSDPDGDKTRVDITDYPEDYESAGFPGTPGWIRADENFDPTDTPLTYDTMVSGAFIIEGYEGETAIIKYLTQVATSEASAFLTSALLVADVTSASNPTAARAADATSQATFGRRRIDHTTKYIDTWAMAQGRADARLAIRKEERERFTVTIKNLDKHNLMEILYRDVSDRVRLTIGEMGISNRDYWIENYVMNLSNSGKFITMTYTLSKVV